MSVKTFRRETYDEIWLGRLRLSFFELKLWRWDAPKVLSTPTEWALALPTMSATWVRG